MLWLAALVAAALPSARDALEVSSWAPLVASVITVCTLALVTLWLIGRLPSVRDPWSEQLLRVVPGIALLVGVAGSLTLTAVIPAAVWIGAYARHAGRRAGMLAAIAGGALLGIGGMVALGSGALLPWAVATALFICSAAAAPAVQVSRAEGPPLATPRHDALQHRRPSSLTGDQAAVRSAQPTPAAGIARGGRSPVVTASDMRALADFLEDARETLDADDVVLWRWSASAEELQLVVRASRDDRVALFPMQEGTPLVQRATQEGRVVDDGGAARYPRLLAGCVDRGERLYGAVSVFAVSGVSLDRDTARNRVARLSAHMGLLLELLEARHRAETEGARTSVLLSAVDDFQRNLDQQALHRSICERAREVSGAVRATFVSWNPEDDRGEVTSSTNYERVRPGMAISAGSLVAEACRTRQRISVPNVPHPARTPIFAEQEVRIRIGSLAIVPLVHEHQTVGAVVVEAAHRDAIGAEEAATLALLGTVAVPSLEASRRLRAESERAFTDTLTGLANRRAFDERLAHVLNTIDRYGGSVSLILADVDHFKRVNDGYGHDAGDEVLKAIGQTVGHSVRAIDLAARIGGEEIAILLPKTGLEGARELAERLRREVANRAVPVRDYELRVTASFGVACYPETTRDQRSLYTSADAALYEAKAAGRNQVKCARQHEGSESFIEVV